jgi:hypothetical protein
MQELVTRAQADMLLNIVTVLGFIVGGVAAALARKRGGAAVPAAALWGGPLVLAGILWRVYNAITDRMGLDSVANLFVNAALFIIVGAACGAGWVFLTGRQSDETSPVEEGTTAEP